MAGQVAKTVTDVRPALGGWPFLRYLRNFRPSPIIAGAFAILLVLGAVGRPSIFGDTHDYFVNGREIARALRLASPVPTGRTESVAGLTRPDPTIMGARSVAYGLPMWAILRLGNLWALAVVQAAIGAWMVWLAWRCFAPGAPEWTAYATETATAVLSSLPFFAGFAMPDVFCGYMVLGEALLILAWGGLRPVERACVAALVSYGAMVHGSNIILGVTTAAMAIPIAMGLRPGRRVVIASGASVAIALGSGIAGAMATNAVEGLVAHAPAGRPPFLAMRLIADGPGRAFLIDTCGRTASFTLCRFKDRRETENEMIWDFDPGVGVFRPADYKTRMAMEREEPRFVLAVLAHDPGAVAKSTLANWGTQLNLAWVREPLDTPIYYLTDKYFSNTELPRLIQQIGACGPDGLACKPLLRPHRSAVFHKIMLFFSLLIVACALWRQRVPSPIQWKAAAILFGGAVVANALICGALSGPFARYEARLIWIVPMIACVGLSSYMRRARTAAPFVEPGKFAIANDLPRSGSLELNESPST